MDQEERREVIFCFVTAKAEKRNSPQPVKRDYKWLKLHFF